MKTLTAAERRAPEIRLFYPNWWHQWGGKVTILQFVPDEQRLILGSSIVEVKIHSPSPLHDGGFCWRVDYKLDRGGTNRDKGHRLFSGEELAAAFGLTDESDESFGTYMIQRFGADCCVQGKFIRWSEYLNIPMPGTGQDGDPNVSIYVSEEMKETVRTLIAQVDSFWRS